MPGLLRIRRQSPGRPDRSSRPQRQQGGCAGSGCTGGRRPREAATPFNSWRRPAGAVSRVRAIDSQLLDLHTRSGCYERVPAASKRSGPPSTTSRPLCRSTDFLRSTMYAEPATMNDPEEHRRAADHRPLHNHVDDDSKARVSGRVHAVLGPRPEIEKIWFSLFTPKRGADFRKYFLLLSGTGRATN